MYCLWAFSLLIFQIVCINITAISSDQKQQLADTLDSLLQFRGWLNINDRAKYQNATGQTESFSGTDLYTFDVSGKYDKSMENRIVHVKNVDRKYNMIVHLLGCVYTKAMLTFLNLLHVTIKECRRAEKRCWENVCRENANKKVIGDCTTLEIHLTSEECARAHKDLVGFENFKTVFDTAFGLLENHYLMFDFMSTALSYLIGLAPLAKIVNELMQDLHTIRVNIDEIKILPDYICFMTQNDITCVNDDDKKYKKMLHLLSNRLSKTIKSNKVSTFVQFKNNHCILPDNEQIKQLKTDYRSDIINEEMKKLENEVCTSFYKYLGFFYNKQSTILRPDNIQYVVDNNNVNNSDSEPNVTRP